MKWLILILAIIIGAISANGQSFRPRIAVDYFTNYRILIQTPASITSGALVKESDFAYGNYRVRIGCSFDYKKLSIYFDQNTYMSKGHNIAFSPSLYEWFTGIQYKFTDKIMLKYEHLCMHPTQDYNKPMRTQLFGGYNMFSISYGY